MEEQVWETPRQCWTEGPQNIVMSTRRRAGMILKDQVWPNYFQWATGLRFSRGRQIQGPNVLYGLFTLSPYTPCSPCPQLRPSYKDRQDQIKTSHKNESEILKNLKSLCFKGYHQQRKKTTHRMEENSCKSYISDKESVPRTYKEL